MSVTNTFTDNLGEETIKTIDSFLSNHDKSCHYIMAIAPTGKGKSYFVKHSLYNYCREHGYKILYLLPRTVVQDEFIEELAQEGKDDLIKVYTYQQFEDFESFPAFSQFNIVICDECHYSISDSTFNVNTYRSYNRILDNTAHAAVMYITATNNPIQAVLTDDLTERGKVLKVGSMEKTFEAVKDVRFLTVDSQKLKEKNVKAILDRIDETEDESRKDIFDVLPNGEKAIVFCDKKEFALQLHRQFKDNSIFICSKHDKKYFRYVDMDAYKKMLHEHKFDCKYVFCTSALDVGFSIKDAQLKHIICLLWDWNSIVQAIGRKRMIDGLEDDTITVYLRNYSNSTIGKFISDQKKKFEHMNYLQANGAEAYMKKYEKVIDPARIVYYRHIGEGKCEPAIDRFVYENNLALNLLLYQVSTIDDTKMKYKNWVRKQFGMPPLKERTVYGITRDLKAWFEEGRIFVGKEGRDEIAHTINCKNDDNRLYTGVTKLNGYLEKLEIPYRIEKLKERVDGKIAYKIVESI